MKNQTKRDTRRAADILDVAEIVEVSTSLVQKTLKQERNNEVIIDVMMELKEGKEQLIERLKQQYNPNYSSIIQFNPAN